MVKALIITDKIPIIDKSAIDFNAGCFANIKAPIPTIVVIADSKMDTLYDVISLFPYL